MNKVRYINRRGFYRTLSEAQASGIPYKVLYVPEIGEPLTEKEIRLRDLRIEHFRNKSK